MATRSSKAAWFKRCSFITPVLYLGILALGALAYHRDSRDENLWMILGPIGLSFPLGFIGMGFARLFAIVGLEMIYLPILGVLQYWFIGHGIDRYRDLMRTNRLAGYCDHCSYNLMGNTSGICPECGEAVEERA